MGRLIVYTISASTVRENCIRVYHCRTGELLWTLPDTLGSLNGVSYFRDMFFSMMHGCLSILSSAPDTHEAHTIALENVFDDTS
jgi:hypothetical protein